MWLCGELERASSWDEVFSEGARIAVKEARVEKTLNFSPGVLHSNYCMRYSYLKLLDRVTIMVKILIPPLSPCQSCRFKLSLLGSEGLKITVYLSALTGRLYRGVRSIFNNAC